MVLFFFQAEDGIRDWSVTGVQTCALPISLEPWCTVARQCGPGANAITGATWLKSTTIWRFRGYTSMSRSTASTKRLLKNTRTAPRSLIAALLKQSRSEEHTSELQSLTNLVCRLLLEKKK